MIGIGDELAALRAGFPGCNAAVFVDLSAGMVLASSTENPKGQEILDALCSAAQKRLKGPDAYALSQVMSGSDGPSVRTVVQTNVDEVRCFVTAQDAADEAICLIATSDVSLNSLCDAATDLMQKIALEG